MNVTTAQLARLRLVIVAAILALAGVLAAATTGGPARAAGAHQPNWAGKTRPVIVLEHGAWADSSSWDGVRRSAQPRPGTPPTAAATAGSR